MTVGTNEQATLFYVRVEIPVYAYHKEINALLSERLLAFLGESKVLAVSPMMATPIRNATGNSTSTWQASVWGEPYGP